MQSSSVVSKHKSLRARLYSKFTFSDRPIRCGAAHCGRGHSLQHDGAYDTEWQDLVNTRSPFSRASPRFARLSPRGLETSPLSHDDMIYKDDAVELKYCVHSFGDSQIGEVRDGARPNP